MVNVVTDKLWYITQVTVINMNTFIVYFFIYISRLIKYYKILRHYKCIINFEHLKCIL